MTFTAAIIGRPNVGKSTLFNRLVGQRLALVDDTPGVTRDRREGQARLADLNFRVIDTAGLEEMMDDSLSARMRRQTDRAVSDADVVLFVIDARTGVTPLDKHFADWLRRGKTPVILLANKAEGRVGAGGSYEAFELGLGEPIAISAEHSEGKLERLSVGDTLRALRFAEVVVLVFDAEQPFEKQDLTIARMVEEEGRSLVIAASKWDAIADKKATLQLLADRTTRSLPQLQGIACVPVSGKTGVGLDRLMETVVKTHAIWRKHIATPQLNRWLADVQERHPPPLVAGRRLKLRFMSQANIRPPTFALFASKPGELPDSYRRYLVNLLREDFDLPSVPIRMMLRKGKNPYAER